MKYHQIDRNLFIKNLFIISTQNNSKLMHFNNIKTLSTMMKAANYCHSKIVLVSKNNLNL